MGKLAKLEMYCYECAICIQTASITLCSEKNCVFFVGHL